MWLVVRCSGGEIGRRACFRCMLPQAVEVRVFFGAPKNLSFERFFYAFSSTFPPKHTHTPSHKKHSYIFSDLFQIGGIFSVYWQQKIIGRWLSVRFFARTPRQVFSERTRNRSICADVALFFLQTPQKSVNRRQFRFFSCSGQRLISALARRALYFA